MIDYWLDWNTHLMQLKSYLEAAQQERTAFDADEFNRICADLLAKWAQRPPPTPPE